MAKILVIDDDKALGKSLKLLLSQKGHEVRVAATGKEGLKEAEEFLPNIALVDLRLPDLPGIELLKFFLERMPSCLVVMITAYQDSTATVEAIRLGAFDYLRKPLDLNSLELVLEKALREISPRVSKTLKLSVDFELKEREIIGADPAIIEVLKSIAVLSKNRVPVLIEGETGTGKELVARKLHESTNPQEPFVAINCSAVVPTLFESELFGHEKGSFTGAESQKVGKLELAGAGTLFLDEVGDMPLELQAKLLRALQEKTFERVGGNKTIQLRARIVAATNRPLKELAREGKFREDLGYRLAVSCIRLPPLRERKGDIPLLTAYLLKKIGKELHRNVEDIEKQALELLQSYNWPGNVRELENVLTRALLLCRGKILKVHEVRSALGTLEGKPTGPVKTLREVEKESVEKALEATDWNVTRAAKLLEISPTTLRKKIKDYGLRKG